MVGRPAAAALLVLAIATLTLARADVNVPGSAPYGEPYVP